jgi:hypothetical protein
VNPYDLSDFGSWEGYEVPGENDILIRREIGVGLCTEGWKLEVGLSGKGREKWWRARTSRVLWKR